jgi:hypothetical protein
MDVEFSCQVPSIFLAFASAKRNELPYIKGFPELRSWFTTKP